MRKRRTLTNEDSALVGIVATFLIVGLLVSVISVIQTVYIPKWMEETEADHLEQVADQFSQLKFAIDTQAALQQPNVPISTSITLGNKEIPFLTSNRAYGSLEILSDSCSITVVKVHNDTSTPIPIGTIRYASGNSYFLNQVYIYEAGAVILSQSEGNTMTIKPAFAVNNESHLDIFFTIVNISTIGEKRSINGYGTYPIQTEYSNLDDPETFQIRGVESIAIATDYQNAWHNFLNYTFINEGLIYNSDFSIDTTDAGLCITFHDRLPQITITIVEIGAQIAPGWIENIGGVR